MFDALNEDQRQVRDLVRRVATEKVAARAKAIDTEAAYPEDMFGTPRALGLFTLPFPATHGRDHQMPRHRCRAAGRPFGISNDYPINRYFSDAKVPRRQGSANRRGHQPDPARYHRPRSAEVTGRRAERGRRTWVYMQRARD